MKNDTSPSSSEPIGQNMIKLISNLCFSAFVFSVLIITVIAITYQPPDPWLQSAPALTKLFTDSENATFKNDNSILKTGEDFVAPAAPPDTRITEAVIQTAEANLSTPPLLDSDSVSACGDLQTVNCSDPRVLIAVERFNLRLFKTVVFLPFWSTRLRLMGRGVMSVMCCGGLGTRRRSLGGIIQSAEANLSSSPLDV